MQDSVEKAKTSERDFCVTATATTANGHAKLHRRNSKISRSSEQHTGAKEKRKKKTFGHHTTLLPASLSSTPGGVEPKKR